MKRNLTCILCSRNCSLEINGLAISGHGCGKGAEYAIAESTHPTRTVTTTLAVSNRQGIPVSVKTAVPVPKEHMLDVINQIRSLRILAPIRIGDVLARDVYGADIVATKNIP